MQRALVLVLLLVDTLLVSRAAWYSRGPTVESKIVRRMQAAGYQETWAEQRIRLLWERKPFRLAERQVRGLLQAEGSVELHPYEDFQDGEMTYLQEVDPNIYQSFYRGRYHGTTSPEPQPPTRKRKKTSYRLDLAYDGSQFCGWQRQKGDPRDSVQASVEGALARLLGEDDIDVRIAGRTDAGVHAAGQVGRVRVISPVLTTELLAQVSSESWKCWAVTKVSEKFHPTFGSSSRSYVYLIDASAVQDTLLLYSSLSLVSFVQRMDRMFQSIQGMPFDFLGVSYGKVKTETTICHLQHCRARLLQQAPNSSSDKETAVIAVELCGDRFLRRMVRILIATVLELALKEEDVLNLDECLVGLLDQRDRQLSAKAAPPSGLVFLGVSVDG